MGILVFYQTLFYSTGLLGDSRNFVSINLMDLYSCLLFLCANFTEGTALADTYYN
jgi:hypothetical protein